MRHLTLAAALLITTTFALAPANATDRAGPLVQNGQCKQSVNNSHEGTFMIWGACPKPAATAVVHHARRHHG